MKNIYSFNKDIFYKLVYGLIFGAITDPNNNFQFADTRVDMFFFSLQKYIIKFKNDILNTDIIALLSEYKSDWYELWENPGLFFEPSDNIYDTYNLYERDHGVGMWFDKFDKYGTEFIWRNSQVINDSILNYIENTKHMAYYELMPISFKPDKNINFLLPYLCKQWKEFITDNHALTESADVCSRMEFKEISFDTAYEWLGNNNSEFYENTGKNKLKLYDTLISQQHTKMHYIMLDGEIIGIIGFNSVYDSFYIEKLDMLRCRNMFPIEDYRNGLYKNILWVSFLEVKYKHSIENIMSVMQKLCEYAKANGYTGMICGPKDERVKNFYMRAGWKPLEIQHINGLLQYTL